MYSIYVKKALAVQAWDVMCNGVSIVRKPSLKEAEREGVALATRSGGTYDGYIKERRAKGPGPLDFRGKHRAVPKGWNWGDAV